MSARPSWRSAFATLTGQLAVRRAEKGFTQRDVYLRLGVSRSTFQRWEQGEAVPDAYELFRWADLLDIAITSTVIEPGPKSEAACADPAGARAAA